MIEQTIAIIKPDAVARKLTGAIITRIDAEGFTIRALALASCLPDHDGAEWSPAVFYQRQHEDRPYYAGLVEFMASGPVILLLLEREDAIAHWRAVMGAWQEDRRDPGTVRGAWMLPGDTMANIVHGSDSPESFEYELDALGGLL